MKRQAIALGMMSMTLACKPVQQSSDVESLDNFARQEGEAVSVNSCGPDTIPDKLRTPDVLQSISGGDPTAVLKTLAAVPDLMLHVFFATGGRIELSAGLPQACQSMALPDAAFLTENTANLSSCWFKQPGEGPVIHIVNDPVQIRHNLLRSLAYIYSGPVADALRLQNKNDVDLFEQRTQRLGDLFFEVLRVGSPDVAARMAQLRNQSQALFNRMVFAETVDSIYCSSETFGLVSADDSIFRPVVEEFLAKENFAESLGREFGSPWYAEAALGAGSGGGAGQPQ